MQKLQMPSHRAQADWPAFSQGPAAEFQPGPRRTEAQTDGLFVELLNAYRDSGGLARLDEVMELRRGVCDQDVSPLPKWIIEREVVSFEWQEDHWLPLFQFNRSDMTPSDATQQVVRALNPILGPWALAEWFARPNALLENQAPADALHASFPAVMRAARAEPASAVA